MGRANGDDVVSTAVGKKFPIVLKFRDSSRSVDLVIKYKLMKKFLATAVHKVSKGIQVFRLV